MATVSQWTPFEVALDLTATASSITRTSATQFTFKLNVSWKTHWDGAKTNFGMSVHTDGLGTKIVSAYNGSARSSGSATYTVTRSISGNGSATKSVLVTFRNFNDDTHEGASKGVSFNITVPAWTSYTVSYNANGGSGAPGSQTKWKNQTLALSSTKPTRTGYTFQKWNTKSDGTGTSYNPGASYTANAKVTLYAIWKANTWSVYYNLNGGTGSFPSQTKTYGQTLKLHTHSPTKTDYTFKGWGTTSTATNPSYQPGGSYITNATVTMYAIWELTYVKPKIENILLYRFLDAELSTMSDEGTFARLDFKWSTFKTPVTITVSMLPAVSESKTIESSNTSGQESISFENLDPDVTYTFTIVVKDSGSSTTARKSLPGAKFVIDFLKGGTGASFGKSAELANTLDCGFVFYPRAGYKYPVLEAGRDLDEVLTPNWYSGENASTYGYLNCPITSGTFTLEVKGAGPNGQVKQILTQCDKTKGYTYERTYYSSSWGPWYGGWNVISVDDMDNFMLYSTATSEAPMYRRCGDVVEVRGTVTPKADIAYSTSYVTIFTLPSGYRPHTNIYTICQGSGTCVWNLRVEKGGAVGLARYRNGNAGATALAPTSDSDGTWLPFHCTFLVG